MQLNGISREYNGYIIRVYLYTYSRERGGRERDSTSNGLIAKMYKIHWNGYGISRGYHGYIERVYISYIFKREREQTKRQTEADR